MDDLVFIEGADPEVSQAFTELGGESGVRTMLNNLTSSEQDVLKLRFMENRSLEDVASILGVNKQIVSNRLHVALKAWEELLRRQGKKYERIILRGILKDGLRSEKISRDPGSLRGPVLEVVEEDPNDIPVGFNVIGTQTISKVFGELSDIHQRLIVLRYGRGAGENKIMQELKINRAKIHNTQRNAISRLTAKLSQLGFSYSEMEVKQIIAYYIRQSDLVK